jgi:hypothetical protein
MIMRYDIISSIILTLVLMMIADFFRLDIFESIFLLLFSFIVLRYRFNIWNYFLTFRGKFDKVYKSKGNRGPYDDLEI